MQWYDQVKRIKVLLVIFAVAIAVASLVVSRYLVNDLAIGERNNMAVWAEAMRTLNKADENTDADGGIGAVSAAFLALLSPQLGHVRAALLPVPARRALRRGLPAALFALCHTGRARLPGARLGARRPHKRPHGRAEPAVAAPAFRRAAKTDTRVF